MDEWRRQLQRVVESWGLPPEDQAEIIDELEQHLEDDLSEWRPRIGTTAALERIMTHIKDPALRDAAVLPRHQPPEPVESSRHLTHGTSGLLRDLRSGWRTLARNPGTSLMGAIALGLGIGLTTVMFSVIYGLLLRGLPFANADRIAMVMEANPSKGEDELSVSMHDIIAFRDAQHTFDAFGAWQQLTVNVADDERPERIDAARITAAVFDVAGIRPMLGRSFRAEDERTTSSLVAVLSNPLWRDRYGADSGVIGRTIRVNGQVATVVGVMPERFAFPSDARMWLPLRFDPAASPWGSGTHASGVGRVRQGVTYAQARAELATIARRIASQHPESNRGVQPVVQPFIRAIIPARVNALLSAMFAAVGLVFLVACTNVTNLLLARTLNRMKEVAVRVALGASRWAIARQFLVEAFILSAVSASLGAVIAVAGIAAFRRGVAGQAPFWADFSLHPQHFVFIALAALLASVVSGLLPAITAARSDVSDVLKDQSLGASSMRGRRFSRGLVVFQLILATSLLVVAALTTKSIVKLRSIQPGFRTAGVMTGRVTLSIHDTGATALFFDRLQDAMERLPGVTAASLSSNAPGSGWSGRSIAIEGRTYAKRRGFPTVRHLAVTHGFFETFGVAVTLGRPIGPQDRAGSLPVAIVNQQFVEREFPRENPIGRRINITPDDTAATWVTIVGVMPNLYATDQGSINRKTPWPVEVLTSFRQERAVSATLAVRTDGDPALLAQPLRTLVASMDPNLPVYSLSLMSDVLSTARWDVRIFGTLFIVFGIVALSLASIGLYAVLAFSVSRRQREMGIRMALGASATNVMRLVFRDGGIQLVVGVSLGVLLGTVVGRAASIVLFDVQPNDPATLAVVVAMLATTGCAACIMPALRATRANLVDNLRAE